MSKKKEIAVGGQAVIEGVMMRGPEYIATAIRRADHSIEVKKEKFETITKKNKFLGLPIIRGFISLIEMMIIGIKTLNFSANRAEIDWAKEDEKTDKKVKEKSELRKKIEDIGSYVFAFGLAFALFAYLPYKLSDLMKLGKETIYFNLFAGTIRIVFFVIYIFLIGLMKDVKRIFEFHGAEHKSVYAYENNDQLNPESVQKYSTLHPRCGTSFIFFVLLISILIFSLVDSLFILIFHHAPNIFLRLAYHFMLVPFVSGISYEVLRFSGKKLNHPLVKIMTFPGLSLQRITTKEPDNDQLEVALVAMKSALELDLSDHKNIIFIKE